MSSEGDDGHVNETNGIMEDDLQSELWQGTNLGSGWFLLIAQANNKLVRLHGASAGAKLAWVPVADMPNPGREHVAKDVFKPWTLKAPKLQVSVREKRQQWRAPEEAVWSYDGDRLRNRGTGGYLNVRKGGVLRGHGNIGPPWHRAQGDELSSILSLRSVSKAMRHTQSNTILSQAAPIHLNLRIMHLRCPGNSQK